MTIFKRFNSNRLLIITTVLVLLIFGLLQIWTEQRDNKIKKASLLYEKLLKKLPRKEALDIANTLKKEYSDTTYAQFAGLLTAKMEIELSEPEKAAKELELIIANPTSKKIVVEIARIRLSQIFLAEGRTKKALDVLQDESNSFLPAIVEEIKGDIFVKDREPGKAFIAYDEAKKITSSKELTLRLQRKISALPMIN